MSDLCMYEEHKTQVKCGGVNVSTTSTILFVDKVVLEDNVWDEFSESDDHIVPHPIEEREDQFRDRGDNHKKARSEIIEVASNAGISTKYFQKKKEASLSTLAKKDRMIDRGLWSHTHDGVFPTSCDSGSVKEVASIGSEDTKVSNDCMKGGNIDSISGEFSANDPILGEKSAADDNDTYHFPLTHLSQTENDLNFFVKNCGNNDNSDLLYYGWPDDIGNFEDVDRMFRSCDSTFGSGGFSNEDDLCWFSLSHSTEGSEDAFKSASKYSSSEASTLDCISEHHEASRLNTTGPSVNNSNKNSLSMGDKLISNNAGIADHSGSGHFRLSNGSDARSVTKDNLMHKEQISSRRSQARLQNHSGGKRKERNLDNGCSFRHHGNFKQVADTKCSIEDLSHQVFPPPGLEQCKQDMGSDSFNYTQTNIPLMHVGNGHSSDKTSVSGSQSRIKPESNGIPSPSPKDSSIASNLVQSMDSSHQPTLEAPAKINEKGERLYHCQDLQAQYARNFKCANIESPTAFYDAVQNQARQSECEVEGHSEIEGFGIGIPAELDSNVQESSCMSSVLDEISLEATSFCQLQQVMEQLDIRTKLCIRDSLYRLARSAEQRHNCVNANAGKQDDRGTNPSMAEDTSKGTGFLDMETDTNPIDRSIAHLLFHRPSDPSVRAVNDALSLKSHTMVHGSITSPSMISKEQVCQEESAIGVDKTLFMSGNNQ